MTMSRFLAAACLAAACLAGGAPARGGPRSLEPFRSEAQLQRELGKWRAQAERRQARLHESLQPMPTMMPAAPPSPAPAAQAAASLDRIEVTGSRIKAEESITNNQVQGVDEGDIVKRRGDLLIVLRRGRLFTLRIGGDRLEPVAMANAFGPDVDPSGAWYDEMLVSGDTVAVIGYSYTRGGTEVGLFDLDARGGLRHRDTYQLRSHDYYSARNYASRMIDRTLVFYSPMHLHAQADWHEAMPAFRRWRAQGDPASFRRILPAERIYRGVDALDGDSLTLHTVSVCDLATREMQCRSTAVLGPSGRVFHVAEDAVYVWTTGHSPAGSTGASSVFRLPLDGGAPSSLRTQGSPVDQMSFLQRDGHLNVLVQRHGRGEGMWNAGTGSGEVALLRVPLRAFGDLRAAAARRQYRALPGDGGWGVHNRFIGDWLVYGSGGWSERSPQQVHAVRYAATAPARTLELAHRLERIDALAGDGVLVGPGGGDLHFTPLRLGADARTMPAYVQRGARQGDDRTHGFFYRPTGEGEGMLGLPILHSDAGAGASVLYLRNRALQLSPLGTLDARRQAQADDGCQASCVDWYGNARPIFVGERVFALLGYELVEGRVDGARIHERRRVDFTPAAAIAD